MKSEQDIETVDQPQLKGQEIKDIQNITFEEDGLANNLNSFEKSNLLSDEEDLESILDTILINSRFQNILDKKDDILLVEDMVLSQELDKVAEDIEEIIIVEDEVIDELNAFSPPVDSDHHIELSMNAETEPSTKQPPEELVLDEHMHPLDEFQLPVDDANHDDLLIDEDSFDSHESLDVSEVLIPNDVKTENTHHSIDNTLHDVSVSDTMVHSEVSELETDVDHVPLTTPQKSALSQFDYINEILNRQDKEHSDLYISDKKIKHTHMHYMPGFIAFFVCLLIITSLLLYYMITYL